jgi:hypothetical protein
MIKYTLLILAHLLTSCGAGISDFTEELSGGYTFYSEGQGHNWILSNKNPTKDLDHLRKYSDDGSYICAWQVDSTWDANKLRNTSYSLNDRFYIIDVRSHKLHGPYTKQKFFSEVKLKGIDVSWYY